MKKTLLLASGLLFFGATQLHAQNWVNSGNTLTANGTIGTNSNHSLLFETYNTERGRITNTGLWGIGTGTIALTSKFNINSVTGQDPLRIMVNGNNKLVVHRYGGMSVGSGSNPPANGLYVAGNVGIGTNTPMSETRLTVLNDYYEGGALVASGKIFGIKGYSTSLFDDYLGTGVYGEGGNAGVYGYGLVYGTDGDIGGDGVVGGSDVGYGGYFWSYDSNGLYATTHDHKNAYAGYFNGHIYTTGNYLGSDKNIKKNIQAMDNAMSIINKLKPSYYQFRDDGKYASLKLPTGNHYGLLAQDVEEVLPNLVKETTHEVREQSMPKPGPDGKIDFSAIKQASKEPREKITIKAVNYTEFIPILIKGAQEQQATIEQQNAKIDQQQAAIEQQNAKIAELTQLVNKLTNTTGLLKSTDSYLSQSTPNPNTHTARITYNLPAGIDKAKLVITSNTGQQIKSIQLNNTGLVDIDTTTFSAGAYFYSLYIDNVLLDTKKMMVHR